MEPRWRLVYLSVATTFFLGVGPVVGFSSLSPSFAFAKGHARWCIKRTSRVPGTAYQRRDPRALRRCLPVTPLEMTATSSSSSETTKTPKTIPWKSSMGEPDPNDWRVAVRIAIERLDWNPPPLGDDDEEVVGPSLAFLFVPMQHGRNVGEACAVVRSALLSEGKFDDSKEEDDSSDDLVVVGVVGAGVIGGGQEVERDASFSILAGSLPVGTEVKTFVATREGMLGFDRDNGDDSGYPSFLLLADPYSPVQGIIDTIDKAYPSSIVAGGLSCPNGPEGSIALCRRRSDDYGGSSSDGEGAAALPVGSALGISLRGPNLEVHTACAQGAVPVGPNFLVTKGKGNLVEELDGKPALQSLQNVVKAVSETGNTRVMELLQRALLVGIPASSSSSDEEGVDNEYLIRTVMGATTDGGIYVGDTIVPNETRIRFHVRDGVAADADLKLTLDRYRAERQFSGRFPPLPTGEAVSPMASILFSCNGRGTGMYGVEDVNHDSCQFARSVSSDVAGGGFFANGEIGPIGVRLPDPRRRRRRDGGNDVVGDDFGAEEGSLKTHLHGFTSVFVMLYERRGNGREGKFE